MALIICSSFHIIKTGSLFCWAIRHLLKVKCCCDFGWIEALGIVHLAENRKIKNWCWTFSHFLSQQYSEKNVVPADDLYTAVRTNQPLTMDVFLKMQCWMAFAEGMVNCVQSAGHGVVRWVAQPPLSVPTDGIVMAESVCLIILVILSLDDNSKP